ncbi:hypothetical protein PZ897_12260 [Hoeflea sp. YIM 152468]|uniref:hypothetical protein n=1 Tax=Hoeflea sp. YIM 152468 TaxID=3031759 RepID=UPI0023DC734B|nr:hypothetical protein [Hoeflea sp. YIM 152468]MDF1608951.1 hypothetical protein [Hoeflea sp. YIM 152468]
MAPPENRAQATGRSANFPLLAHPVAARGHHITDMRHGVVKGHIDHLAALARNLFTTTGSVQSRQSAIKSGRCSASFKKPLGDPGFHGQIPRCVGGD